MGYIFAAGSAVPNGTTQTSRRLPRTFVLGYSQPSLRDSVWRCLPVDWSVNLSQGSQLLPLNPRDEQPCWLTKGEKQQGMQEPKVRRYTSPGHRSGLALLAQ